MKRDTLFLLNGDLSPILGGGTDPGAEITTEVTQPGATPPAAPQEGGFLGMGWMIGIWALVIVGFYFLTIRPQRKREKETKEMQSNLKVGDNVLTNGGMYGRIADVGQDCFVVEFGTNRGVRIPIRKSDVIGIKTPQLTQIPDKKD